LATLNLTTDVRTAVWRLVKAQLQADTVYDQAGIRLLFLDGDPEAIRALDTLNGPALRFIPASGNQSWFDEASTNVNVIVYVEAYLSVPDVEDLMNLQGALETTLNSVYNTTLQSSLVAAGASTGLILFSQPLNPMAGQEGQDTSYRARGQFVIEVRRPMIY
jgi:hypothetical protein